jgi:HTH-type transcriptional regulator/antitoxin HigA
MEIKPIKNNQDHDRALREIERLWGSAEGTPRGDRLEILISLVEAYERRRFPINLPDPISAIHFRLEQQGLDRRALVGLIGSRSRVYEVLRGDRPLSLAMIRRLHEKLGVPADVLIRTPARRRRAA